MLHTLASNFDRLTIQGVQNKWMYWTGNLTFLVSILPPLQSEPMHCNVEPYCTLHQGCDLGGHIQYFPGFNSSTNLCQPVLYLLSFLPCCYCTAPSPNFYGIVKAVLEPHLTSRNTCHIHSPSTSHVLTYIILVTFS